MTKKCEEGYKVVDEGQSGQGRFFSNSSDIINIGPIIFNPDFDSTIIQNKSKEKSKTKGQYYKSEEIITILKTRLEGYRKMANNQGVPKEEADKALLGVEKTIEAFIASEFAESYVLSMALQILLVVILARPKELPRLVIDMQKSVGKSEERSKNENI
jgi:hypothetical protein